MCLAASKSELSRVGSNIAKFEIEVSITICNEVSVILCNNVCGDTVIKGKRQKAKGKRQKAEGRRKKEEGTRQMA